MSALDADILDIICEIVYQEGSIFDLCSLTRTSRICYKAAIPWLYRSLHLNFSPEALPWTNLLLDVLSVQRPAYGIFARRIRVTMDPCQLGEDGDHPLVKDGAKSTGTSQAQDREMVENNRQLKDLIQSLPNIQFLGLDYGARDGRPTLGFPEAIELAAQDSPFHKLRSLTLEGYIMQYYYFESRMLPRNLQSLTLVQCEGLNNLNIILANSTIKLQTLIIEDPINELRDGIALAIWYTIRETVEQHLDTLEVLAIRNVRWRFRYVMDGGSNKLRVLDLHDDIPRKHLEARTNIMHFVRAVLRESCPQLEVLCISLPRAAFKDDAADTHLSMARPQPDHSLERSNYIYFTGPEHIEDDLVETIPQILSSFTKLRELRLYFPSSHHYEAISSRSYAIQIATQIWSLRLQTFHLLSNEPPELGTTENTKLPRQGWPSDMKNMHWQFTRDVQEADAPLIITDMQQVAGKLKPVNGLIET